MMERLKNFFEEKKDYPNLTPKQITKVKEMVKNTAEASKKFDLIIEGDLLKREEKFFLGEVNRLKSLNTKIDSDNWDEIHREIGKKAFDNFREEAMYFFEKFKNIPFRSAITYNCHLDIMVSGALNVYRDM